MNFLRTSFALLILLLSVTDLTAQEASDFSVTNYNSDNGLPQNSVMKLEVDKNGFLWATTQAGLVRFDGTHFEVYDQHNTKSMKSDRIIDLGLTSDSTVFCKNTAFNILTFDENNEPRLLDYKVRNQAIVILSRNRRYNVIDSLDLKSRKFVQSFFNPASASTVLYNQIGEKGDGFLRISDCHIFYLQGRHLKMYRDFSKKGIDIAAINKAGILGTSLYYFDSESSISRLKYNGTDGKIILKTFHDKLPLPLQKGSKALFQQGSQLFLMNAGKLYRLQAGNGNELWCYPVLNTGNLKDIVCYRYVPKMGIHVVGTGTKGLYVFKSKQFRTVSIPGKNSNFYSQHIYKKNAIITEHGIIYPDHYFTGPPFPLLTRTAIFEDRQKRFWVTGQNGETLVLDQELHIVKRYKLGNLLSDADADSQGNVWVSTASGNLGKIAGDSVQWSDQRGIYHKSVTAIAVGKDQLWVSDKENLYTLNTRTGEESEQMKIDSTDIRVLYQDRNQVGWIGTYGRGFYAKWKGRLRALPLDRRQDLLYTHSFQEDGRGFLWISTNHGLFKCKLQDLYDYLEGKLTNIYYHYYDKSKGFNTNEFNGGCSPASIVFPDGKFSYPSMDGLVQFYPDSLRDVLPGSRILIDKFITDGKSQQFTKYLILEPSLNRIEIRLASPYFGTPENQVLEYNVKGLDAKWYLVNENKTITLNRLAHGEYTLQVRKRTGFGRDNVATLTKQFIIKPFWYQTWYFHAAMLVLIVLSFFALVKLRYFYLINRKKQLEAQVKERTLQLEYSNKLKEKITMLLAHDLQSPLHFLNVLSDYVSASVEKEKYEDVKAGMHEIKNATGKIHAFISDINLWTKSQQDSFYLTKRAFSILELIRELEVFFTEMLVLKENTLEIKGEDCEVYTNREILKAVLRNLIDNANKYTSGGKIVVSFRKEQNNAFTISIADNGVGMSPADLSKINRRIANVMTSEGIEYSGRLGYQIIIDFVARLECRLCVQSEKGKGTIVTISELISHSNVRKVADPELSQPIQ